MQQLRNFLLSLFLLFSGQAFTQDLDCLPLMPSVCIGDEVIARQFENRLGNRRFESQGAFRVIIEKINVDSSIVSSTGTQVAYKDLGFLIGCNSNDICVGDIVYKKNTRTTRDCGGAEVVGVYTDGGVLLYKSINGVQKKTWSFRAQDIQVEADPDCLESLNN